MADSQDRMTLLMMMVMMMMMMMTTTTTTMMMMLCYVMLYRMDEVVKCIKHSLVEQN